MIASLLSKDLTRDPSTSCLRRSALKPLNRPTRSLMKPAVSTITLLGTFPQCRYTFPLAYETLVPRSTGTHARFAFDGNGTMHTDITLCNSTGLSRICSRLRLAEDGKHPHLRHSFPPCGRTVLQIQR